MIELEELLILIVACRTFSNRDKTGKGVAHMARNRFNISVSFA
jgi:hypothetical protein